MDGQKKNKPSRLRAFFGRVRRAILRLIHRIRDRKTHVYRRCPVCKNFLRLPREVGDHGVNCPVCHGHFMIRIKR